MYSDLSSSLPGTRRKEEWAGEKRAGLQFFLSELNLCSSSAAYYLIINGEFIYSLLNRAFHTSKRDIIIHTWPILRIK